MGLLACVFRAFERFDDNGALNDEETSALLQGPLTALTAKIHGRSEARQAGGLSRARLAAV